MAFIDELKAQIEQLKSEKKEYEQYVERQLTHMIGVISQIALGDYNVRAQYEKEDDFAALVMGINMMIDEINKKVREEHTLAAIATEAAEAERAKAEELQMTYEELNKTQAQLIHGEKLSALGQMVAGIAHELHNPLTVISCEAQMLLKEDHRKDAEKITKIILEQTERIKAIIETLLEFSRVRPAQYAPLDVNNVVEKSISLLMYQAEIEGKEIITELNAGLPTILADNTQLQQVFLNIMLNAVQAMERGGKITVQTRKENVPEDKKEDVEKFTPGRELAVVAIEDTGKGMDAGTREKVFMPFFSTKEQGTGLGLAICQKIVEEHKGVIEIDSRLDAGTRFIIKLPAISRR
ncbi:MAG: ATP-binding protein [Candidatus Omnitrophota bacterium]